MFDQTLLKKVGTSLPFNIHDRCKFMLIRLLNLVMLDAKTINDFMYYNYLDNNLFVFINMSVRVKVTCTLINFTDPKINYHVNLQ